jgi:hypothetical protein
MPPINGLRPVPMTLADASRATRPSFTANGPSLSTRPTFPGQPGVPPMTVQLSSRGVSVGQGTVRGQLVADRSVLVKIGTVLPAWRLYCAASDLVSATGDRIPAAHVFVQPLRSPADLGAAGGPAVSCDPAVLVAQGRATGAAIFDANSLAVRVLADLDVPAGNYTGVLHVIAYDMSAGGLSRSAAYGDSTPTDPVGGADVIIQASVPDDFTVTVTGDPMNFGSVQPSASGASIFTCVNTPKVVIETNKKDLSACVVMNALVLAGGSSQISGSRTALAWGATSAAALTNVGKTAIGQNAFSYDMKKTGTYTFYLAGRVSVTAADTPGSYQGQAAITVNEQ